MNKQERIAEILELMNIPEFEKLINIKVEELKIILAKKIKLYLNLKNEFSCTAKDAEEGFKLLQDGNLDRSKQTFFFELNRVEDRDNRRGYKWILKKIDPEPKSHIKAVIPVDVVERLGQYQTNPSKIVFDEYQADDGSRKFHLKSIKYNDSRVFGTIRIVSSGKKSKDASWEENKDTITLDVPQEKVENEKKYTELFRYMEKYPEIKEHIFAYFYMIQKPVVDNAEEMAHLGIK